MIILMVLVSMSVKRANILLNHYEFILDEFFSGATKE